MERFERLFGILLLLRDGRSRRGAAVPAMSGATPYTAIQRAVVRYTRSKERVSHRRSR